MAAPQNTFQTVSSGFSFAQTALTIVLTVGGALLTLGAWTATLRADLNGVTVSDQQKVSTERYNAEQQALAERAARIEQIVSDIRNDQIEDLKRRAARRDHK